MFMVIIFPTRTSSRRMKESSKELQEADHPLYVRIMEKKMETTIMGLGYRILGSGFRVQGVGLGSFWDNGKENGNCYIVYLGYIGIMEKKNVNYYFGFRV